MLKMKLMLLLPPKLKLMLPPKQKLMLEPVKHKQKPQKRKKLLIKLRKRS